MRLVINGQRRTVFVKVTDAAKVRVPATLIRRMAGAFERGHAYAVGV